MGQQPSRHTNRRTTVEKPARRAFVAPIPVLDDSDEALLALHRANIGLSLKFLQANAQTLSAPALAQCNRLNGQSLSDLMDLDKRVANGDSLTTAELDELRRMSEEALVDVIADLLPNLSKQLGEARD